MRTVAIIQARMGSTRLPGKVLMPIGDRTMLAWVVTRAQRASALDEVTVATTESSADDAIVAECVAHGVRCFRGSEDDVLDRYHQSAAAFEADVVVRVTSDCPLIDPGILDEVIAAFENHPADYVSNFLTRRHPRGLDVEVMSRAALDTAWRNATQPYERAHVTPYLYRNQSRFRVHEVVLGEDHSDLRWTVDTHEDLEVVRRIVDALGGRADFTWREALEVVRKDPRLAEINRSVRQKALEDG
jgi:spore coat polysaccharide biosynthesis protein SpsF